MRVLKTLAIVGMLGLSLNAAEFSRMVKNPTIMQEGEGKSWCGVCGMSIPMFYKTSHAIILEDGTHKHYCSIKCQLEDNEKATKVFVADAKSEKMIDATTAFFVIGSSAPATMSSVSKYAFSSEADAKEFQAKFGGELGSYEDALASSRDTQAKDNERTRGNWENRMFPMGKKIYEEKCDKIDVDKYDGINKLKEAIVSQKLCKNLEGEKELQPLAQYLWQNVTQKDALNTIIVPKYAKCPTCGMFVAKYPEWATKIEHQGHAHYFDGVKDMMDFILKNAQHVDLKDTDVLVSDFKSLQAIDAKKAFYVIGSDVTGPMGDEAIPFKDENDAKTFLKEKNGKKVLRFDQLTLEVIESLN